MSFSTRLEAASMTSPLTVVSGLPRSGTSLMMNALAAGGHPTWHDDCRPADLHNPKGYYEDQRVSSLATDADWLREHDGQAVKITSHLLAFIPEDLSSKVLFMRRPLPEIVASQNAMLGRAESGDWETLLRRELGRTLAWLQDKPHLKVLEVSYPELLEKPQQQMERVAAFLERDLDVKAMAAAVDPALYRQRSSGQGQR